MKFPWLDLLVLTVILNGAGLAVRTGLERRELQLEHERLQRITGELSIDDPSRVYLRATKTDDPLEFTWRIYLPKAYRMVVRDKSGGSSWTSYSNPLQFTARVRLRESADGVQVYSNFHGSSGLSYFQKELADLMRGRWDQIIVEQFAREHQESLDAANGSAVIIRFLLPEDLQREAREKWPEHLQKAYLPAPVEIRLGSPAALP